MDKSAPSDLFVNDGSFMERFKQLQGEKKAKEADKAKNVGESKPTTVVPGASTHNLAHNKTPVSIKANGPPKAIHPPSGGKLAFSLKQKSKLVAPPIKLGADEDDDETDGGTDSGDTSVKRQKVVPQDMSESDESSRKINGAPTPPSDLTVKNVADKLAAFVAKHGRHLEDVTRQKNPGDNPFKFLNDTSCADYKYYEYRLCEEEKVLSQAKEYQASRSGSSSSPASKSSSISQRSHKHQPNYQTPASALYESADDPIGGASAPSGGSDPIAMMEFYMKKAAQEEKRRQPRQSKDEMPPPACLQGGGPGIKGHHMGDFIPPEELEKFMASCHGVAAQKAAEKAKIQADNVGHKLLSKMGWKEGEGLGSSGSGIADPIMAGDVKKDNLGIGAQKPGEVSSEDDIYEQYKKRMMLGYRYRPNPLGNPRKSYY